MSTIREYNMFLDSKYRSGGGNPNPSFNLKSPISLTNPNHYFMAQIKSVDIPYSFKSLSAPFNVLRVRYQEVGHVDSTTTLTIPEGNYSISILLSTLEELLKAFIDPIAPHPPGYNFIYDKNSGKCTLEIIRLNGNHITNIYLFWSDLNTDFLSEFFGFIGDLDSRIGYLAGGVPSNTNNISQINVNCSPISSLYIRSSTLTQPSNNEEFLTEFDESVSDIILKVPVNVPYGSWIIYIQGDVEVQLNNKIIDVLQFYLTHLSYQPISLQGVHWRLHLYIREVRPVYLDEIEKVALENEQKIKEMEDAKGELLNELEGLSTDLKQRITVNDNIKDDVNVDELKGDLMNEIERNRQMNKEGMITTENEDIKDDNNVDDNNVDDNNVEESKDENDVEELKDDFIDEIKQNRKKNKE